MLPAHIHAPAKALHALRVAQQALWHRRFQRLNPSIRKAIAGKDAKPLFQQCALMHFEIPGGGLMQRTHTDTASNQHRIKRRRIARFQNKIAQNRIRKLCRKALGALRRRPGL